MQRNIKIERFTEGLKDFNLYPLIHDFLKLLPLLG